MYGLSEYAEFIGRVATRGPTRISVTGSPIELVSADAGRLAVIIATNIEESAAPDIELVQIGIGASSAFRAFATLSHQSPYCILRLCDYAHLILGQIMARTPSASTWLADVSQILLAR